MLRVFKTTLGYYKEIGPQHHTWKMEVGVVNVQGRRLRRVGLVDVKGRRVLQSVEETIHGLE